MFLGGCVSTAGWVIFFNFYHFPNLFVVVVWECGTHLKGECSLGDVGAGLDAGQGFRDGLELLGWDVYKAYVGVIGWLKTTAGSTRLWRSCQKAHYWKRIPAKHYCSLFRFMQLCTFKFHVLGTRICLVVPFIRIWVFLRSGRLLTLTEEVSQMLNISLLSSSNTFLSSLELRRFKIFKVKINKMKRCCSPLWPTYVYCFHVMKKKCWLCSNETQNYITAVHLLHMALLTL